MIAPAAATNGRRLPNRSDRMPPTGLEITMPTTEANVAVRMTPVASCSDRSNLPTR